MIPTLVMQLSDGSIIPGNRNIGSEEVARRIRVNSTRPTMMSSRASWTVSDRNAVIISIHSFTPVWKGRKRPWEVGVLWDNDRRLAGPLMARLSQHAFLWGDNEPYSGALENDCLNRHGTQRGLPHVLIEIRQDLIGSDGEAEAFAHRLGPVLDAALADMAALSG